MLSSPTFRCPQDKVKSGSSSEATFGPNSAAVICHYACADGNADAIAGIFTRGVQTAEYSENLFRIRGIKTDTVIRDAEVALGNRRRRQK